MTATQFALAVLADSKWVQNAARILGTRFRYTISEARWLGLVRLLNQQFFVPLGEAGKLAESALQLPPDTREARLLESDDGSAAIVLDVARYHSSFAVSLSAALTLGTPRRRGRRAYSADRDPIERARKFGVDLGLLRSSLALTPTERLARLDSNARFMDALGAAGQRARVSGVRSSRAKGEGRPMSFQSMLEGLVHARVKFVVIGGVAAAAHGSTFLTNDLDICYDAARANVERLAELLASCAAYPRGVERGLPFFMDERTFRTTPIMTLDTAEGAMDVLDRVEGVGEYHEVRERSEIFRIFGLRLRVLGLSALIDAKRAAGRPKDLAQLPELEALMAMQE